MNKYLLMFATVLNVPVVNKLDNKTINFHTVMWFLGGWCQYYWILGRNCTLMYSISPFSKFCFIEVSPTRFLTSVFFIIRIYLGHWPTVKIFSMLVKFLLRYSNFSCEKTDSPGNHNQWVKILFYPRNFLQKKWSPLKVK